MAPRSCSTTCRRLQIVYGLLTNKEGVPVAIEVFKGNTGDPTTVASQVKKLKLKERFSIAQVCLVGDRGMLAKARLKDDVVPAGLDYITALRAPEIKALVEGGTIQLGLFDETDLFEVAHPDYPGERLVACKNPALAEERATTERASRSTDSRACWPTWLRSRPTASSPTPTFPRSRWSRHRPHFSAGPSSFSASRTASATCSQYPHPNLPRTSWQQWLSHEMPG
jgi:hypothetical protein